MLGLFQTIFYRWMDGWMNEWMEREETLRIDLGKTPLQ